MKSSLLLLSLLLTASGTAWAQQPTPRPDSATTTTHRVIYSAPNPAPMTAADSARERARKENARRLRQQPPTAPPQHAGSSTSDPILVPREELPGVNQPAKADPKVLEKLAREREKDAKKGAETDKKREKTLYKRAKKDI